MGTHNTQTVSGRGGNIRNSRTTFPMKERRREEAIERQAEYDKLTPEAKVGMAGEKQLRKFAAGKDTGLAEMAEQRFVDNSIEGTQ